MPSADRPCRAACGIKYPSGKYAGRAALRSHVSNHPASVGRRQGRVHVANHPIINFLGAVTVVGIVVACVSLANAPQVHGSAVQTVEPAQILPRPAQLVPRPTRREETPYEIYAQAMVAQSRDLAYANVMTICGLQSRGWLAHVVQSSTVSFARQRDVSDAYFKLSPAAIMLAQGKADRAAREETAEYLSSPNPRVGCAKLSKETGLTSDLMQP